MVGGSICCALWSAGDFWKELKGLESFLFYETD